ncbi:MAG: PLP-dependent transferase [Pirellulaceae bacterium]
MTQGSTPHGDILQEPRWRPEDLGKPLPPSLHANSVCLPTWNDVVGYEEKDPRVISRLQTGYPRFFLHPLTRQFFGECEKRFAGDDEHCRAYPTRAAAERSLDSILRWSGHRGRIERWSDQGPFVACFPEAAEDAARKHWCHAGEGISSRRAEALLQGAAEQDGSEAKQVIRERIAALVGTPVDCVYLFSSGMGAIYTIYRCATQRFPQRNSVQFGFPYVDTLKIQQQMGGGANFFPRGDDQDLRALTNLARSRPLSAIFCEFPSNPLLVSPDLTSLARIAQRQEIPLVVDETLGNYINVDLLPVADVLTTSLTKYFTGAGDVMGGAVIVNPHGRSASHLRDTLDRIYEETLWGDDAIRIARYSADFPERMEQINRTAERICDFCRAHPAIEEVYYPQYRTPRMYESFKRPGGGYGGLFSILFRNAPQNAPRFYDAVRICKGPNLGTYFSLCCPFTLLAHYDELDFVERCGVNRHLLRFSVGLEEPQDLLDRLSAALDGL